LRGKRAVVIEPPENIVGRRATQFGEDAAEKKRRGEDLLEGRLERGGKIVADEAAGRHVVGRAGEPVDVRGVDHGLPDSLDVRRVADAAEGEVIVNLEELRRRGLDREQENARPGAQRDHGQPGAELVLDVFAAIGDRLKPAVGFLGHDA
jgi:hypothetical protein